MLVLDLLLAMFGFPGISSVHLEIPSSSFSQCRLLTPPTPVDLGNVWLGPETNNAEPESSDGSEGDDRDDCELLIPYGW